MNELVDAIEEFDAALPEMEIDEDVSREFDEGDWSLGSELEVLAPRDILRGFLVPIRNAATGVPVTLKVFAFLTINDCKDILDRHLHQGIHYPYALADNTHTTTMVCWDTRWRPGPKHRNQIPSLFHELHGKGAKFASARPGRWGDEKRKSIRDACAPDLLKWPIGEFRCASDRSSPVWPRGASLTPRLPQPAKTKRGKHL
ncbi:hypothetical protein [Mesorhizobium mediterraneum]|uniref:hypothetical protein n=1 Tax=Mesorhizobium mediterraneum TaxID=43617 RepID=UPI001780561C|nr:hypothetical protein [Mesorhizobium mediterraneum]